MIKQKIRTILSNKIHSFQNLKTNIIHFICEEHQLIQKKNFYEFNGIHFLILFIYTKNRDFNFDRLGKIWSTCYLTNSKVSIYENSFAG